MSIQSFEDASEPKVEYATYMGKGVEPKRAFTAEEIELQNAAFSLYEIVYNKVRNVLGEVFFDEGTKHRSVAVDLGDHIAVLNSYPESFYQVSTTVWPGNHEEHTYTPLRTIGNTNLQLFEKNPQTGDAAKVAQISVDRYLTNDIEFPTDPKDEKLKRMHKAALSNPRYGYFWVVAQDFRPRGFSLGTDMHMDGQARLDFINGILEMFQRK